MHDTEDTPKPRAVKRRSCRYCGATYDALELRDLLWRRVAWSLRRSARIRCDGCGGTLARVDLPQYDDEKPIISWRARKVPHE